MTGKLKLDNVDRQILTDLQSDGRMTNVDLAKRAGISAPPCLRRVRVLEEGGIIRGYHADLDPESLGYSVQVFAFVGLTSQAETDLQDFEEMVSAWPQVRECHMLMGETDFLLKIVAHDWDDFQKFLTSRLTPAPNVSHVKTALSIRSANPEDQVFGNNNPLPARFRIRSAAPKVHGAQSEQWCTVLNKAPRRSLAMVTTSPAL